MHMCTCLHQVAGVPGGLDTLTGVLQLYTSGAEAADQPPAAHAAASDADAADAAAAAATAPFSNAKVWGPPTKG